MSRYIGLLDLVCYISCDQLQDGLAVGSQTEQQIIAHIVTVASFEFKGPFLVQN
jgi:hypothetical protein